MNALFRVLWPLCLFRGSPAALPHLPVMVVLLLLADWALSVLVSTTLGLSMPLTEIVFHIGVAQVILGLLIFAALRLRKQDARWAQTLIAVFGCDLLLTALFGVLLPISTALGDSAFQALRVLLQLWTIAVYGYILHLALELPLLLGMAAAFALLVLGLSVNQALLS